MAFPIAASEAATASVRPPTSPNCGQAIGHGQAMARRFLTPRVSLCTIKKKRTEPQVRRRGVAVRGVSSACAGAEAPPYLGSGRLPRLPQRRPPEQRSDPRRPRGHGRGPVRGRVRPPGPAVREGREAAGAHRQGEGGRDRGIGAEALLQEDGAVAGHDDALCGRGAEADGERETGARKARAAA